MKERQLLRFLDFRPACQILSEVANEKDSQTKLKVNKNVRVTKALNSQKLTFTRERRNTRWVATVIVRQYLVCTCAETNSSRIYWTSVMRNETRKKSITHEPALRVVTRGDTWVAAIGSNHRVTVHTFSKSQLSSTAHNGFSKWEAITSLSRRDIRCQLLTYSVHEGAVSLIHKEKNFHLVQIKCFRINHFILSYYAQSRRYSTT